MRGNLQRGIADRGIAGSIPACAGEPLANISNDSSPRVYPRVCGGTENAAGFDGQGVGLSPRVRGNLWDTCRGWLRTGSIPACAGEPRSMSRIAPVTRVYPRVCGGTLGKIPRAVFKIGVYPRVCGGTWKLRRKAQRLWGLSPRVRGNP